MQRTMLKSKIHRATVSDCDLHYVGSITIDPDLLEAADILEHEQVAIVDVDNGARFETYTIAVISYGSYDKVDMETYEPRVVHVEKDTNRIINVDQEVATLLT